MPRKRKYAEFFEYKKDGRALCLIGGCSRPDISRSQSNGMSKHLKVHHAKEYASLTSDASKPIKVPTGSVSMSVQTDLAVDGEAVSGESDRFDEDNDTGGYPQSPGGIQANGEAVDVVGPVQRADNVGDAGSEQPIERDSEQVGWDSDQEWEVDGILEKRVTVEYLLKWKGYSAAANSWEKAENLTHCDELLEEFHGPHPPTEDANDESPETAASALETSDDAELPEL